MNILLINHYAGSNDLGMEYRPFFMGKEWVKMGHSVTILSASFAHVRIRQPDVKVDFSEENINGINYCWIKTPKYSGNGFDRLRNMIAFSWKIYKSALLFAKKFTPDVVIASSTYTYDNYGAKRIANRAGARYIYEVHDLWPLSPMELGGISQYHPFILTLQHAENFAYRNADRVISMLPNTLSYMMKHGLRKEKWHYVPNGIHPEDRKAKTPLPESHKSLLDELKEKNNKIIIYTLAFRFLN
jgi:glycosyltransferase involved in cell wall biosynthesis